MEPTTADWALYPNPAQGLVSVEWTGAATTFEILDAQGRIIRTAPIVSGRNVIDLDGLAPGQYFAGPQGVANWTKLQIIR